MAVLNSRQFAMLGSRLVLGPAIPTRQHTFAFSVRPVCASTRSSSKCRSLFGNTSHIQSIIILHSRLAIIHTNTSAAEACEIRM